MEGRGARGGGSQVLCSATPFHSLHCPLSRCQLCIVHWCHLCVFVALVPCSAVIFTDYDVPLALGSTSLGVHGGMCAKASIPFSPNCEVQQAYIPTTTANHKSIVLPLQEGSPDGLGVSICTGASNTYGATCV